MSRKNDITILKRQDMKYWRSVIIFLLSSLLVETALGANHYVRAGASGNNGGSDWRNAYQELPRTLTRGDVYYVAAGTYSNYTVSSPVAGKRGVTMRKAVQADHGSDIGWQSRYGDGVARWRRLTLTTSYITFDGVTGSGTSNYGFEIFDSASGGFGLVTLQNAPTDIIVRHVDIHFPSRDVTPAADGFYGATPASKVTISHCYIHDIPRAPLLMRNWTNLLFEFNWVARNKSTPLVHSEGVSTHGGGNFVFRYNRWEDIEGTGIIVNLERPTANWEVYGNVFFSTSRGGGIGHGIVADNFGDSAITHLTYYNNTAVGLKGANTGLRFFASSASNITAYNNLWYRCQSIGMVNVTHDYNYYGESEFTHEYRASPGPNDQIVTGLDPFIDAKNGDFRLARATSPGKVIPYPFNRDMLQHVRGDDGNWDRGAYEYIGAR